MNWRRASISWAVQHVRGQICKRQVGLDSASLGPKLGHTTESFGLITSFGPRLRAGQLEQVADDGADDVVDAEFLRRDVLGFMAGVDGFACAGVPEVRLEPAEKSCHSLSLCTGEALASWP